MKITASARSTVNGSLNQLPSDILTLLENIGFVPIPNCSGTYGILDDTGEHVILYDDNSGDFYKIVDGALGDGGATVCGYLNDTDGWETLLADYPKLSVQHNIYSLEEALNIQL